MRRVADGYPPFLHGLEQGALDFGGGAVDFVRQEQVGEHGALVGHEFAGSLVQYLRPQDVRGEHVDRELYAAELELDGAGERVDQQRFGQPGNPHQEKVAAGE